MRSTWKFSPIGRHHDRAAFHSGEPELDDFLHRFARQNQELDIGRTWVATLPNELRVMGFYTLSASAVAFVNLPDVERKRLPQYPVPVAHLGRLANDISTRGQGLGEELLLHALEQTLRASHYLAVSGMEVRAKSDGARGFYGKYGFVSLLDDRNHLYLSIKVIRRLFGT